MADIYLDTLNPPLMLDYVPENCNRLKQCKMELFFPYGLIKQEFIKLPKTQR